MRLLGRRGVALLAFLVGVMAGCMPTAGPLAVGDGPRVAEPTSSPGQQVTTSGDDPSTPVPFQWTLADAGARGAPVLALSGGTLHSIPSQVRLLGPAGQVVASAPASGTSPAGACPEAPGLAHALLPLPAAARPSFESGAWPAGFRLEAQVAAAWRPAAVAATRCQPPG